MRDLQNNRWNIFALVTTNNPFTREKLVVAKIYENKYNIKTNGKFIVLGYKQYIKIR